MPYLSVLHVCTNYMRNKSMWNKLENLVHNVLLFIYICWTVTIGKIIPLHKTFQCIVTYVIVTPQVRILDSDWFKTMESLSMSHDRHETWTISPFS